MRAKSRSSSLLRIDSALRVSDAITGTATRDWYHCWKRSTCSPMICSTSGIASRRFPSVSSTTPLSASTSTTPTPGMRATSGSTSRGTAMSTMNSGRCGRASIASATLPGVRMKCDAPVEVTTTSTVFSASTSPGMSATRAISPSSFATSCARLCERFSSTMSAAPSALSRRAATAPILPAPTTSTRAPLSAPRCCFAYSTAADATEAESAEIAVCVRAFLPASSASRNSVCSVLPSERARCACTYASLTWLRISASPMSIESRPVLTRKRCSIACVPSSVYMYESMSLTSPWRKLPRNDLSCPTPIS